MRTISKSRWSDINGTDERTPSGAEALLIDRNSTGMEDIQVILNQIISKTVFSRRTVLALLARSFRYEGTEFKSSEERTG